MNALARRLEAVPSALVPRWLRARAGYVALALCAVTGVLGVLRLGAKSLWHDEAFSYAIARLDFPLMWRAITHGDAFNGLYYVLLHLWVRGGDSEAWLRLPSVVFGLLAAYTLFALNRRLFGLPTALVAAVLLAINSFFIQYDQEARPYSLAVFLVVLSTYLFVIALEDASTWRWLAYGAVSAVAVYAHLFSALIVVAHIVSLALRRPRPRWRNVIGAYGLIAVLVVPLLAAAEQSQILQRAFIQKPDLASFQWLFLNLAGAGGVATRSGHLLLLSYFVVCCVAVLFMVRAAVDRRHAGADEEMWAFGLVLLWLGVPILGSFLVSIIRTPIFLPRYLIVGLPALVTIGGIGIASLSRRWVQALAFGVLIALSIPPAVSYYRAEFKEGQDWRRAVGYVTGRERPGDGVVFLSRYGRRPFEYYLDRFGGRGRLTPIYPGAAWGRYVPVFGDIDIESTEVAAARLGGYERVWVVLVWRGFATINEDGTPFRAELGEDFGEVTSQAFGPALHVRLYQRTTG